MGVFSLPLSGVLIGGVFPSSFRGSNWGCFPFLFVLLRAEGKFCKKIKKNKNNFLNINNMAKKDPTDLTVEEKLKALYQLQTTLSAIDEKRALLSLIHI